MKLPSLGEYADMMNFFWPILAVLVGLALAFIWWPWLREKTQLERHLSELDRNLLNVDLFKQRVGELELELAQGTFTYGSTRCSSGEEYLVVDLVGNDSCLGL